MSRAAKIIHRLAIAALIIYVVQSFAGMPQYYRMASHSEPPSVFFSLYLFTFLFATIGIFSFWIFSIWRFWKSPRSWSLGLGIFLCFVLAFQIFLWNRAIHNPARPPDYGTSNVLVFALYEIPLVASIALCFLLRWKLPGGQNAKAFF